MRHHETRVFESQSVVLVQHLGGRVQAQTGVDRLVELLVPDPSNDHRCRSHIQRDAGSLARRRPPWGREELVTATLLLLILLAGAPSISTLRQFGAAAC